MVNLLAGKSVQLQAPANNKNYRKLCVPGKTCLPLFLYTYVSSFRKMRSTASCAISLTVFFQLKKSATLKQQRFIVYTKRGAEMFELTVSIFISLLDVQLTFDVCARVKSLMLSRYVC